MAMVDCKNSWRKKSTVEGLKQVICVRESVCVCVYVCMCFVCVHIVWCVCVCVCVCVNVCMCTSATLHQKCFVNAWSELN